MLFRSELLDVVYLLNGPAIEEFRQDFTVSDDDLEDLDE